MSYHVTFLAYRIALWCEIFDIFWKTRSSSVLCFNGLWEERLIVEDQHESSDDLFDVQQNENWFE